MRPLSAVRLPTPELPGTTYRELPAGQSRNFPRKFASQNNISARQVPTRAPLFLAPLIDFAVDGQLPTPRAAGDPRPIRLPGQVSSRPVYAKMLARYNTYEYFRTQCVYRGSGGCLPRPCLRSCRGGGPRVIIVDNCVCPRGYYA